MKITHKQDTSHFQQMKPYEEEIIARTRSQLQQASVSISTLRFIWETKNEVIWSKASDLYEKLAKRTLKAGEPFWTYDIAKQGLRYAPNSLTLMQTQALSLAQSGSTEGAHELLNELISQGYDDPETLSILGRIHKDFWRISTTPREKENELRLSYETYLKAFEKSNNYYPGINAATMAVLGGNFDEAHALAKKVHAMCKEEESKDQSYWLLATIAEAAFIKGDIAESRDYYSKASALAMNDQSSLCSIRKQARLLSNFIKEDPYLLDDCFNIGSVVVFSGHIIDHPNRPTPRFPADQEKAIKDELKKRIQAMNGAFGFASAACGSDILFLEAMQELGHEIHIILPFAGESFKKISVDIIPNSNWAERYEILIGNAASITYSSQDDYSGGAVDFEFANQVLLGIGNLKSLVLDTDLKALAVWDENPGDGMGGTADSVEIWKTLKIPTEVIKLKDFTPASKAPSLTRTGFLTPTKKIEHPKGVYQEIKAIFFSDVVGFSKLTELDIPIYYEYFLGGVARLLEKTKHKPVIKNTWGDAVYLVFDSVSDAGNFSVEFRELVASTDWLGLGLSQKLNVRCGIHAGPVTRYEDPVTKMPSCTGYHVSRGARIEPITQEGQIYVSETFAALATMDEKCLFNCDYVGEMQLAKKYGIYRVYILREEKK